MEILWVFGSCVQEIHSWFTNHEPFIPTLILDLLHCFSFQIIRNGNAAM